MNKTKVVAFVTEHRGEVSYTGHDLAFPLNDDSVDFDETKEALASSDDFRLVRVKRWGKVEIELPGWMDPSEFVRDWVCWKWVFGLGARKTWPEPWLRFIAQDLRSAAEKLAVIKLLTTFEKGRFRSEYRQSLAEQLVNWLENTPAERRYDSPFSPRQWRSLLNNHIKREAEQTDAALYRSGI